MEQEDENSELNGDLAAAEAAEAAEAREWQRDQEMAAALRSLVASGSGARIFRKVPAPQEK